MTKKCVKCSYENTNDSNYCQNCGLDLNFKFINNPTCPICKTNYHDNSQYCEKDGNSLVDASELIPKCVICHQQYNDNIEICPEDGGKIKTKYQQKEDRKKYKFNKPQSSKMFLHPFSFKGRIRRTEYALSILINIISLIFIISIQRLSKGEADLLIVLVIPLTFFIIAQATKRCHDLGNSGWFQLIPFYGFWLLFQEGENGKNKYGPDPKENINPNI